MTRKRSIFFRRVFNIIRRSRIAIYCLVFTLTLVAVLNVPARATIGTLVATDFGSDGTTDKPLDTSHSLRLPNQELLQSGKNLYQEGKFADAVKVLQQAVSAFSAQGDVLKGAIALNLLSLAQQELGHWQEATTAIAQSLQLLRNLEPRDNLQSKSILAQALNTQGHLQLSLGQASDALSSWEEATITYTQVGDRVGTIGSLLNQAQAMQSLGLTRREVETLTQVRESLEKTSTFILKTDALRALGDALRRVGELEQSQQVLQQSLEVALKERSPQAIAQSLLALGNTARASSDTKAALEFYTQVATTSASPIIKVQAQLNQLSLLVDELRLSPARELWPQIKLSITQLPPSRTAVYAQINFAESLGRLRQTTSRGVADWPEIARILASALQGARSLGDGRAEAYALGELGGLYEATKQLSEAQDLTQQALLIAQALNAPDIAYRWQWQLGRILKSLGKSNEAIATYTEAVNTLKSLRSDLVSINTNVQFSFRKSVEPVYRQLIGLLLNDEALSSQKSDSIDKPKFQNSNRIGQALELMDSLQFAELDNFFKDTCLQIASGFSTKQIDSIDPTAAAIYPIILEDRLNVILSLPGQPLRYYSTPIAQGKVESTVAQLRRVLADASLTNIFHTERFLPLSQQLYDWLIRPIEAELASNKVKTLVFVPDGWLRNIPMSVLHDGKQYLLEKYAIALNPTRRLLGPNTLAKGQLKVLTAGLTESRQGFAALPAVANELKQIQSEVPSVVLLNQEFTTEAIQQKLESTSFPIVHLATHGNFSSKAEKTFILTWDGSLNIKQIEKLLKAREISGSNAIELLVLSACQTALGDDRAALGLAGMAVRSGARSTLATLWAVSDEATSVIMSDFYSELANKAASKAEALRHAQLKLLKQRQFQHPVFWAPYVLVGNWL